MMADIPRYSCYLQVSSVLLVSWLVCYSVRGPASTGCRCLIRSVEPFLFCSSASLSWLLFITSMVHPSKCLNTWCSVQGSKDMSCFTVHAMFDLVFYIQWSKISLAKFVFPHGWKRGRGTSVGRTTVLDLGRLISWVCLIAFSPKF